MIRWIRRRLVAFADGGIARLEAQSDRLFDQVLAHAYDRDKTILIFLLSTVSSHMRLITLAKRVRGWLI